jgi:hypothetical protein
MRGTSAIERKISVGGRTGAQWALQLPEHDRDTFNRMDRRIGA